MACIRAVCSRMEIPEGPTNPSHKRAGIRTKPQATKSIS